MTYSVLYSVILQQFEVVTLANEPNLVTSSLTQWKQLYLDVPFNFLLFCVHLPSLVNEKPWEENPYPCKSWAAPTTTKAQMVFEKR